MRLAFTSSLIWLWSWFGGSDVELRLTSLKQERKLTFYMQQHRNFIEEVIKNQAQAM